MPCLFSGTVEKLNSCLSVSTFASKNISGTLFVVCLPLRFFLKPFSGILNLKSINDGYSFAVSALNTLNTA